MNIDQTPPAATSPLTTEDSKQETLDKPSRTNDNSNPQQGPGSVHHSDSVKTASRSDSASITTVKIPPTKKDSRKLFVGGLPSDVTGDEFRKFFQQFGNVMDSVVMYDRETRRSRGFGFVTFEDPESAGRVLSMGNENNMQQQQDNNTNNDPPVARLEMRGKKIEAKAAEPKESIQRHNDERHSHSRGRTPFPSPTIPNMMTMYGPDDPNFYYNYNALGHYYAPHAFAPPQFDGYMAAPMYYPEQFPQHYSPVMPMVEGYPQYPAMDAAYGYTSVPFATPTPHIYDQTYGTTPVMPPMAPDISVKEGGEEVEGNTAVTQ